MKLLSISIVILVLLSGIGAGAIQFDQQDKETTIQVEHSIQFSSMTLKETQNDYIQINVPEAQNFLMNPGAPLLPRYTKTYELPFGASNIDVQVAISDLSTRSFKKQIQPSPAPIPLSQIEK